VLLAFARDLLVAAAGPPVRGYEGADRTKGAPDDTAYQPTRVVLPPASSPFENLVASGACGQVLGRRLLTAEL
jgi:hypothetical protein